MITGHKTTASTIEKGELLEAIPSTISAVIPKQKAFSILPVFHRKSLPITKD
ncbi:hypothetical protein [Chryseobacterium sp. MDT2-18]|uniref:hypothetical protein n=1 Tax=Chryseobacterium sp. MDT2-18 TaxID=1259136 RepID=UPI0027812DE5|nr:hypothetical protein [Chryseobacterium sp. MDT2-18]MDQ0478268.1 hypothetical protein [Chryseobacterium sp. MDT2-18]